MRFVSSSSVFSLLWCGWSRAAASTPSWPTSQSVSTVSLLYRVYSSTGFQYRSVTAPFPFIHHKLFPAIFSHSSSSFSPLQSPANTPCSPTLFLVLSLCSSRPDFSLLTYSFPPTLPHSHHLLNHWERPDVGNLARWLHRTCMNDTKPFFSISSHFESWL